MRTEGEIEASEMKIKCVERQRNRWKEGEESAESENQSVEDNEIILK